MIQQNLSLSIINNDFNNQQPSQFRIKPSLQLRAVLSKQTASELTFKRSFNDLNKMQQNESIEQQKINLNNYILYEPDSASEVYGHAYHTVKKQSFLWKVVNTYLSLKFKMMFNVFTFRNSTKKII